MSAIESNQRRFHIIIDAWNCDPIYLNDKGKIEKLFHDIVKICGMSILYPPVITEGIPENPGLSGFMLIDFSHMSIHTFTIAREICVDIFSCKPFDYEKVREYIRENFGLEDKNMKYIQVKYPEIIS
ncbi:MAG: S-adenosylmethionine decarboxylase [Patescibacteria group bacterium]